MDRHGMRGSFEHGDQGKPGRITAAQAISTVWRNTSWNLLGTGLPMLLALITVPILIHGAGIERFGVLTIAWAILDYFGLFDLGVGRATIKFLAESFEHDRAVESREIFWTTVLLSSLFGLLGGLILVALTPWLVEGALNVPTNLQTETRGAFYLLALGVPLTTTTLALRGTLEAKHNFRLVNIIQVPNSALTQAAPLVALLFGRDLRLLVGAMLLSRLCGACMFLVSALRNLEHPLRGPFFSRNRLRTLFSYSSWQGVSNTISPLMETGDRFVVGALSSLSAVAYYATPAEVIKRLLILPVSVGRTTFPIFSAGISLQEQTRVCIRAVKRLAMIIAPLAATIIVLAPDLLGLWVGPSFADRSAPVLQILAVGLLANSLAVVPFGMIQGLGRPDVTAKFHLLELPIFFLLLWYGVQHWGIAGAATAWTARVGLDLGLLTIYTGRTKRVDMRIVAEEDLRQVLGLGLLLLAAGWLLQELITQPLLKCSSWCLVLCVVAYITWHKALTVEEQTSVIRHSKKLAQTGNYLRKWAAKAPVPEDSTGGEHSLRRTPQDVHCVGKGLAKQISMMTYPSVFVIVLNWNSWKQTIECLGSIFRNDYPNYRVIVCDNDSQDGSLEYIKAWAEGRSDTFPPPNDRLGAPYIPAIDGPLTYEECTWPCLAQGKEAAQGSACLTLIQTGNNLGYGGGNNVGLKYAFRSNPTTYALVVNSDVVIPSHFLTKVMNAVLYGPARNASVVGFPAYFHQHPRRLECAYLSDRFTRGPVHVTVLPEPNEDKLEDAMAHGAALAIAPSAPVKFFPEEYFLYCEDADYCRQVRSRGGNIFIQLDNPVYHRGSKIVGVDSPLQIYYTRRSKLTYCRKYNPPMEYGIVLARMLYSTLKGCIKSLARRDRMSAKAYILSYWHHLRGEKGRKWV